MTETASRTNTQPRYRLVTNDGAVFDGSTLAEIVNRMKHEKWGEPEGKQAYMIEVIERVERMTGHPYRKHSMRVKPFVQFLIESGVATLTEFPGTIAPEEA